MKKLKYLVTGAPRSGTNFMCRFLTSCGFMCGHESIFTTYGIDRATWLLNNPHEVRTSYTSTRICLPDRSTVEDGSWFDPHELSADSSYMAAPFLRHPILQDTKVIHLIRNPFKVISSIHIDANFFQLDNYGQMDYMVFVDDKLPLLRNIGNRLQKNIRFYLDWNAMVETTAKRDHSYVHRMEDGIGAGLFDFLGIEPVDDYYNNPESNKWYGRERDEDFHACEDKNLLEELRQFCLKYDYSRDFNQYLRKKSFVKLYQ